MSASSASGRDQRTLAALADLRARFSPVRSVDILLCPTLLVSIKGGRTPGHTSFRLARVRGVECGDANEAFLPSQCVMLLLMHYSFDVSAVVLSFMQLE